MTSISTTPWQTCAMPSVPSNVGIPWSCVGSSYTFVYIGWLGELEWVPRCMHAWWMTVQEVDWLRTYCICKCAEAAMNYVHINQCWYTAPRRVEDSIGRDAFQIAVITILSMYTLLCTVCTYVCTWNIQLTVTVCIYVHTYCTVHHWVTSAIGLYVYICTVQYTIE